MAEKQDINENSMPDQVGHYKVVEKVGQGGMALVYRGIQPSLNRPVAIKILPRHFADSAELVGRFDREASIASQLSHPSIVQVIDRGKQDDILYIVMEFVEGHSLATLIGNRELTVPKIVAYATHICDALDYAHSKGVIHRDLKPTNILIDSNSDRAKVADFGIAQIETTVPGISTLTMDQASLGTMNYMSPEQRTDAHNVDYRSDIFSFGVLLYEMLTGKLPIGHFKLPSQENRLVPVGFDAIVKKCLQANPEERYQNASEIVQLLNSITGWHSRYKEMAERVGESVKHIADKTSPWLSGKRRYVAAGASLLLVIALALFWTFGRSPGDTPGETEGVVSAVGTSETPVVPADDDTVPKKTVDDVVGKQPEPRVSKKQGDEQLIQQLRTDMATAVSLSGGDQWLKAVSDLRDIVKRYPDMPTAPEAQFALAKILEYKNADADSIREYESMVRAYPQNSRAPEALLRIGGIFEKAKSPGTSKKQKALDAYIRLIDQYPDSPQMSEAIIAKCRVEWDIAPSSGILKKTYDPALQRQLRDELRNTIERFPNCSQMATALTLIADICQKPGLSEYHSAADALVQLYELDPSTGPDSLYKAARLYRQAEYTVLEIKTLDRFLQDFPNDGHASALKKRREELNR